MSAALSARTFVGGARLTSRVLASRKARSGVRGAVQVFLAAMRLPSLAVTPPPGSDPLQQPLSPPRCRRSTPWSAPPSPCRPCPTPRCVIAPLSTTRKAPPAQRAAVCVPWSPVAHARCHSHSLQDALEKKGMSKVRRLAGCRQQPLAARARSARCCLPRSTRRPSSAACMLPTHPALPPPLHPQTTFEFHYGKHHAAYLNNLNGQIAGKDLEKLSIEEVMLKTWNNGSPTPEFNNAAQVGGGQGRAGRHRIPVQDGQGACSAWCKGGGQAQCKGGARPGLGTCNPGLCGGVHCTAATLRAVQLTSPLDPAVCRW